MGAATPILVALVSPLLILLLFFLLRAPFIAAFYPARVAWTFGAAVGAVVLVWGADRFLRSDSAWTRRSMVATVALVLGVGLLAPAAWEVDAFESQARPPPGYTDRETSGADLLVGCWPPCELRLRYDYPDAMAQAAQIDDALVGGLRAQGWNVVRTVVVPMGPEPPECWTVCRYEGERAGMQLHATLNANRLTIELRLD